MKNKFIIILFLLSITVFKTTAQKTLVNTNPSGAGLRPVSAKLLLR